MVHADDAVEDSPVAPESEKPPSFWREELKRAWSELRGSQQTPSRVAVAVAIGLFVGSQPIFGLHTFIVLGLCMWLRLDAALSWVASNISNPVFAPFLLTAEVQVGGMVLTGAPLMFDPELAREIGVRGFVHYAFVGAVFVGLALAMAGALLVYGGLRVRQGFGSSKSRLREPYRLPANAPAWWRVAEVIASRFSTGELGSPTERAQFHYVRIKLLRDPVMKMIADLGSERNFGEVLDLGTGRGQLPLLLLVMQRACGARGFDCDAGKIAIADRAAKVAPALAATFDIADVREAVLLKADTVLLIDVLHDFGVDDQDVLLDRAAASVRVGGRLLVREADTERGWRSLATLVEEKLFTALRFNRGPRVRFRPSRIIVDRLEKNGFEVEVLPAWSGTPFSNVLIVAERKQDGST